MSAMVFPATNIGRAMGNVGVFDGVYKTGSASTLDIVERVKQTIRTTWALAGEPARHHAV